MLLLLMDNVDSAVTIIGEKVMGTCAPSTAVRRKGALLLLLGGNGE